jgi:hypothetical protein
MTKPITPTVLTRSDLQSIIGEGFHTAFRKATDSPIATDIWAAIRALPDDEWRGILAFIMECLPDQEIIIPKRGRKR